MWENSTFDFCNKVKGIALRTFKVVQSQNTFHILFLYKFQQVCFYLSCCYKGNVFHKCCSYIIFIYIIKNSKSYENVLTPGGIPKTDKIGTCGALMPWKRWKEVFVILHDSKQLLWRLFYHSAYEKKDKYLIDFTSELVSGGYYIHREVGRECVKLGVSRSDREGWNVCNYLFSRVYVPNKTEDLNLGVN